MRDPRKGGWRWFALLCIIASSRWVFEDQWPQVGSTLRSEAWACAIASLLVLAVAIAGHRTLPSGSSALKLLAVGGGLFAAPVFGAALSGPPSDSFDRTVALCFVPTITTVLMGIWSDGAVLPSLWPGLAGLGGALLVFPLVLPSDVHGYAGLIAPPVAVGAACVACGKVTREIVGEWSAALLLAGGAICLAITEAGRMATSQVPAQPFSASAVAVDGVLAGLAVMVLLRADTLQYVSRYFVVPLLIIVEGMIVLRERGTLRLWVGIALLAVASAALLRVRGSAEPASGLGLS